MCWNWFWQSDPDVCYVNFRLNDLSDFPCQFLLPWLMASKRRPQSIVTYLPAPRSHCQCCRVPLQRCWPTTTCPHLAPLSAPLCSSCCRTQRRWQSQMTPRTSFFCSIHQGWWCIASARCTHWSPSGPAGSSHQQGCSIAAVAAAGCCGGCDAW